MCMSKLNKGLQVLVAGTCINLTIGVLYAWSVIKKALVNDWGWTNTDASMPYNVAIVVWAVALLIAGALQDRIGPKKVITLGVVLVGLGMILSSMIPQDSVLGLTVAFGGVVGTGIGFAYACVTPAAMKWFHSSKKGMVSGITVGGFGLAAVYLAPLCTGLIDGFGISQSFMILGSAVLVIGLPLTRVISNPPEGYVAPAPAAAASASAPKASGHNMTWREMMKTRQFYFLWIMFVFSSSAGVMIIGNLASIATDQAGILNPAYLVSILAISNASGRVGGGILSDRIGRTNTMLLAFALLILVVGPGGAGLPVIPLPRPYGQRAQPGHHRLQVGQGLFRLAHLEKIGIKRRQLDPHKKLLPRQLRHLALAFGNLDRLINIAAIGVVLAQTLVQHKAVG